MRARTARSSAASPTASRTRASPSTARTYALTPNEGPHQLHGGAGGPRQRGSGRWRSTAAGGRAAPASPDGDQGYPGAVDFAVSYRLEGAGLVCEMRGFPDRPTPINLANHSYYNLGGGGHGPGPRALDRRRGLHADRRRPDPARRDPPGRGHASRLPRAARDRRHPARRQPRAARRPRPAPSLRRGSSCPRTGVAARALDGRAGAAALRRRRDDDRGRPATTASLRAVRRALPRGAALPDSLHHPDWPSIIRTPEAPTSSGWRWRSRAADESTNHQDGLAQRIQKPHAFSLNGGIVP